MSLLTPRDPIDQAATAILRRLSARWSPIDSAQLTSAEGQALTALVHAGVVEERVVIQATMHGFPQRLTMVCRWSGEVQKPDLCRSILQHMPEWLNADGERRGQLAYYNDTTAARFTVEGEETHAATAFFNPEILVKLLRGRRVKGRIAVESCQVEAVEAPGHATLGPIGPAAVAQARADVNVVNQVTVAPVFNVQVPAEPSQVREASPGRSEPPDPTVCAHAEPDRTANSPPTKAHSGSESDKDGDVESLAALLGSENVQALRIVQDPDLTVDAKIRLLLDLDRRFAGFDSARWAEVLHVSPQAVRKTDCWVQILRKGQNK